MMTDRTKVFRKLHIAAERAYGHSLQTGSGGNLSARDVVAGQMIVKSSGGSFADCTDEGDGFVITDFWGSSIPGSTGKPTREVVLHAMLYQLSETIGGVMHTHSPFAIAYAFHHDILPMTTWHVRLKFGCDIPVLDIPSPMVRPEDTPLVRSLFDANPNLPAFLLRGHGIVAVGKDVLEAEHNAELVEETAKIAVLKELLEK